MTTESINREEFLELLFDLYLRFERICKTNHLRYWLAFGSLIGAVRHKDFIPWDDDFDVYMPRKDYEKLFEFFQSNNNCINNCSLLEYRTTKNYPYCCSRLNDGRYIQTEPNTRQKYNLGLNFDIYILDGSDPKDLKQIKKLTALRKRLDLVIMKSKPKGRNCFYTIAKSILKIVLRFVSPSHYIKKMNKVAMKYDFETSTHCGDIVWDPHLNGFKKEWFNDTNFLEFHRHECPVPAGYKDLLTLIYGDYMTPPPISERKGYHILELRKK